MPIPAHVQAIWTAFSICEGGVDEGRFYEAFCFGDSAAMANELGQLVLAGVKRATAGAVWSYEAEGKHVPKPGDLGVVTDAEDRPLCIIETTQVDLMPFDDVSAEFAAIEGEGNGSLGYWRQAHLEYFTRECAQAGRAFSSSMPIACEQFVVVYPLAARSVA